MATTPSRSKFFSWGSKSGRHQHLEQEPYYRTGGLLQIDTSVGNEGQFVQSVVLDDEKDTTWRRNPKNLSIVPPDYIIGQSPVEALQKVKSAPNLLTVFSDNIFPATPGLSPTACIKSKYSLPPSPALPAELPGSILLDNQGYPVPDTPPPDAESICVPTSAVTSVRSMFSLSTGHAKPGGPTKVPQHRKSANDLQRRSKSRPSLVASPSSTDSRITVCSAGDNTSSANSTKARIGHDTIVEGKQWKNGDDVASKFTTSRQTVTRSKQLDELKATITAQDHTISTLQSQFANLRVSHEAHVASLVNAHSLEIQALNDYTKSLESQQRGLHHASSNHLLFMLDTTDNPLSPKRSTPSSSAGSTPVGSIRSLKPSHENPRSPLRSRNNSEMESLKKKLSTAKRPETGNGDAVRELNLYKQNNQALQKQVDTLMAKLNQSEEEGRKQRRALEEVQKTCDELQEKASKAEELNKSTMALQNTIDHLEYRLEVANVDKIDAQEQLLNMRDHRTPFGPRSPKLQDFDNRQSTRTMSTVFANDSPISPSDHEPTTLAAFIAHIERLQEQIRQKDTHITKLEAKNDQLRRNHDRLQNEHRALDLQSDIQGQLLTKARQHEIHIEELRTAIIKREAMIGEKSKALQQVERQLEHHRLLLAAEIRRHASFTLLSDAADNPLPELTSLASKEDIDRWIERLQKQLNKDRAERKGQNAEDEGTVEALRRENDFYIREIIYYKLDCRGYKSDIKKLKRVAAQMGGHKSRPGEEFSPDPSVSQSADTPAPTKFISVPSNLGASTSPSPVSTGPMSLTIPLTQRMTPPPSELTPDPSPVDKVKRTIKRVPVPLQFNMPLTPRTPPPPFKNPANEDDSIDPGISPRSVAKLSPERRKPTPPSPDQEKFGELATNFPLSTPAAPKRHDRRSLSDPLIRFSSQSSASSDARVGVIRLAIGTRERSESVREPSKGKSTPERPPRPRIGLFDMDGSSVAPPLRLQTPPRMNVLAEAMRNSPSHEAATSQTAPRRTFAPSGLAPLTIPTANLQPLSESRITEAAVPAPLTFRSREGSTSSAPGVAGGPFRRPSTASSGNVPFVIAMGSPHNPALALATPPPTACPITAKVAPTLRTGIGNTMASTTPIASPTTPSELFQSYFHTRHDGDVGGKGSTPLGRSGSLGSSFAAPTAASRSRTAMGAGHKRNLSASASSLRQAINLNFPARLGEIKGRVKGARKESIGAPTPLASPFDASDQHIRREDVGRAV